ncbi:hypothetical protein SOVF_022810, partial [Spinacia oleracea]
MDSCFRTSICRQMRRKMLVFGGGKPSDHSFSIAVVVSVMLLILKNALKMPKLF